MTQDLWDFATDAMVMGIEVGEFVGLMITTPNVINQGIVSVLPLRYEAF